MAMTDQTETQTGLYTCTALFVPAEEGGYVVTFPAIPNLATQGETLEEARAMAADCLQGYLEWRVEDGLPLPPSEDNTPAPSESRSRHRACGRGPAGGGLTAGGAGV